MKIISYKLRTMVDRVIGEGNRMIEELADKVIGYSEENMAIAKAEAVNGEVQVTDDFMEVDLFG